jgi:hypothetical protein
MRSLAPVLLLLGACTTASSRPLPEPTPVAAEEVAMGAPAGPCATRQDDYPACMDSLEAVAMRASPTPVRREGLLLRIARTAGKSVDFQDDTTEGDEFVRFRYLGHIAELRGHLLEQAYYEGGNYLLLTESSDVAAPLAGIPVVAPGGAHFAAASLDLEAAYDPNELQVFANTAGRPQLLFSLDGGELWGAEALRWLDPNTLEFTRVATDEPRTGFVRTRMRLTLAGLGFRLEPAPVPRAPSR